MILKNYKQNKAEVLALYEEYEKFCNNYGRNLNDSIKTQAEKIQNEIFNLMILGEAKSGKSTFINAYLGKEVVPMDVRQCTSAIIKIHKGNKFELVAKTAGGGETIVTGDDKIQKFLKDHAAISDKYRNIPITTINNELLIKYRGRKIEEKTILTFLEEESKDNIFNMNIEEYNNLIREYIRENAKNWGKIITEIEITYPLPEEMQGITIIDSPGVGAGGNVGRIAEDYISNANAIIFVKSLNGQALESSSFMNFLRNNCTNRKKESLFLVLTGKSNLQGSEFESLKEQAIDMYKNDIMKEKIIFVDSKIQLFLNKCRELGTEENIDKFFDKLDEEGNDFAPASYCWLKSKGDIKRFEEKMLEMSNFINVRNTLEKFAREANYIQLVEFLENLENEYKRFKGIYLDALKVAKESVDAPIALEEKIEKKKNEITEVFNKLNKDVNEISKKYLDNINGEGIIIKEAEKMQKKYEEKLEGFRNLKEYEITDSTFGEMKNMTLDAIDDAKKFRSDMSKKIIKECNEKLIKSIDNPSQIPFDAYAPNFTETDFDDINNKARKKTSGYEDIEEGITFKKVEKVPYHNLKKHIKLVADSIYKRLIGGDETSSENIELAIIPTMIDNTIEYLNICIEIYREKLIENKKELEAEYEKLLKDKDDNEKRMKNVSNLELKVESVKKALEDITKLKEDLNNYVRK